MCNSGIGILTDHVEMRHNDNQAYSENSVHREASWAFDSTPKGARSGLVPS
jgi:hypothetical protein